MVISICDDDQVFTASVKSEIQKYFKKKKYDEQRIYVFNSAEDMLKERRYYDFAFLDVEMPGLSGIAASGKLKEWNKNILIFIITSHNTSYLDDALEEGVYRYMMKPLNSVQFQVNMNAAMHRRCSLNKILTVETDKDTISINTDDIIMVYTERRKVFIKTINGIYKTTHIFQYWIDTLPDQSFALSFKGILVHLKYVRRVGEDTIEMTIPNETVYLSTRNRASFKKKFMQYISTQN